MPSTKSLLRTAIFGLLAATPFTAAHTWVEQLMVIAPNGTLVGQPGFARGNVLRGTPGFSDPTMVNLIPPDGRPINQIEPSDLMCKSTQTSQTQTDGSPRLQAAPGSAVALRFQENGHVTLPDNQPGKPPNRGTVFVYGTTQPSPDDSFLAIHRVWNANGTGGDGRGVLLSTRNFDDGQCYQVNGGQISQQRQQQFKHTFNSVMGNDLWCQQDVQIPSNAPSGQPYTLYWVWDWPTLPGTAGFPNGKQEIYTTCLDIDIVDNNGAGTVSNAQANFVQGQAVDNAAIAGQFSDIANPTAVTGQSIPFTSIPIPRTSKPALQNSTQPLTSYIGSTIPFSASATGPAVGGASEASAVAATQTDTGVPAFLTVHTGSTAGPGVETQSFTVIPIGVSTPDAQPTPGQGRGGHGGDNNAGESDLESILSSVVSLLNSMGDHTGPQVTPVPNANAAVATFTEYHSVTETVFQTVYNTRYTKRDGKPNPSIFASAPSVFPTGSRGRPDYPASRLSRWYRYTTNRGHMTAISPTYAPGEPHSVFRGGPRNHSCGTGDGIGNSSLRKGDSGDHGRYGDGNPWFNSMHPASMASVTTLGSIMTMPDGLVMTMPVTTDMATDAPFPPESESPSESPPNTVYSMPSDPDSPSLPANPVQSSVPMSLTIVPISDSAPTPTVAPRAAAPDPADGNCSTAHSAYRLRARNPFIWLGWSSSSSEAKATAGS
ncbi:hypothetical protein A1O3_03198 [Capronia epimyces CBS 606.96]|uniref:DUF7492 domain-containing protein n=1 Tax=Capronia epimyces CBS 606.96 TaxID=1182542 RepID=W9Z6J8_9EURO|nr:uncharacterized protein A1O3_03198 [Capronia epimyces CBS 606.96]EXJ90129.1 hypothetical protein A1O3_03198 [Capronia epimyces CBS 606.96]